MAHLNRNVLNSHHLKIVSMPKVYSPKATATITRSKYLLKYLAKAMEMKSWTLRFAYQARHRGIPRYVSVGLTKYFLRVI